MGDVNIPNGWAMTTLGEVADEAVVRSGPTSGEFIYVDISSVDREQKYISDAKVIESSTAPSRAKQVLQSGDVLISMTRPNLNAITMVTPEFHGAIGSTGFHVLRSKWVEPKFLFYLVQTREFIEAMCLCVQGALYPAVRPKDITSFAFLLPPSVAQHRIVAKIEELFSELDKGIENLKTARAQLKVYRQALLKHAFEGKLTVQWRAENQDKLETADALLKRIQQERAQRYQQQLADWEKSKSPAIPLLQRGKTTSTAAVPPFEKGGLGGISGGRGDLKPKALKPLPPLTAEDLAELPELPEGWGWFAMGDICLESILGKMLDKEKNKGELKPYLRNINVRWGKFDFDDLLEMRFEEFEYIRYGLVDSDLVICEGGEPGRCAVWRKEFGQDMQIQKALHRVRFTSSMNSSFVQMYFELCASNRRLEKMFTGTTIKHLTGEKLARMAIPICSIGEQVQILLALESKFSEVDQLEQTITTSLHQAEALRQSILKKAFSGQLVAQDASDEPASVLLARIKAEKSAQVAMAKARKPKKAAADPAPGKSNVIPFPAKLAGISATDLHAGILARAYQHHAQDKSNLVHFGHVKIEKIAHLVEAHLGIDLEREPVKDAAGPNDYPHLMKVESRARKANWFDVRKKNADAYVFSKRQGFDALLLKTMHALGERADEVDALISLLVPMNKQQVEIVATLYAAWNNLLLHRQSPSDEEIVYEARENWHEAKLKIERKRFFIALGWMRQKGLVPAGNGRHVGKKK